jgi:hypothetical protein
MPGLDDTVGKEARLILTVRWQTHGEKLNSCEHSLTREFIDDASPQPETGMRR